MKRSRATTTTILKVHYFFLCWLCMFLSHVTCFVPMISSRENVPHQSLLMSARRGGAMDDDEHPARVRPEGRMHKQQPEREEQLAENSKGTSSSSSRKHQSFVEQRSKSPLVAPDWLHHATRRQLHDPTFVLDKNGNWHQVISILHAWLPYVDDNGNENKNNVAIKNMQALCQRLGTFATVAEYSAVLQGLCQTRNSGQAREYLVTWQERAETGSVDSPTRTDFRRVWRTCHANEKETTTLHRLHAWMYYLSRSGKNPEAAALLRTGAVDVLHRHVAEAQGAAAEQFGLYLSHLHLGDDDENCDAQCRNLVLRAYTAAGGRAAAEQATRILVDGGVGTMNAESYAICMYAWADDGSPYAVDQVESLLARLTAAKADTAVWNAVLATYEQARVVGAVERAAAIVNRYAEHMNVVSYNRYLHVLTQQAHRNSTMVTEALRVLDLVEKLSEQKKLPDGGRPNTFTYNLVIETCCRAQATVPATQTLRRLLAWKNVEPDTFSFNQLLSCLAKDSSRVAGAEKLFLRMKEAYELGRLPHAQPDSMTYSAVIAAMTRTGDENAPERAQAYLEAFQADRSSEQPSIICYNALIDCWAKSGLGLQATRKAEAVLMRMQEDDNIPSPNLVSYNSVLDAWAKSGTRCCGVKAEQYLNKMWELYQGGDMSVKPNDFSYNTVINAISKSKHERKAQRALRMLRQMDKNYQAGNNREARPTVISYTAVLNSCAFPAEQTSTKGRRRALDVAIFTLKELQATPLYGKPNTITYATFLQACANLAPLDDELRCDLVKRVFEQCCRDGQVSDTVLRRLRLAAPDDLCKKLLPGRVRTMHDLPPAWRCNVRPKRRVPRRIKRR